MLSPYEFGPSVADQYAHTFLPRFARIDPSFAISGEWSLGLATRKGPSDPVVSAVYARDGLVCTLCGLPGQRGSQDQWALNLDHVTPHSLRGANHETNLRVTHIWCNSQRQLTPYPETILAADDGRCRRCGLAVTGDMLIEHLVDLNSPAMWDERCAWPCHRACHQQETWPDVPMWSHARLANFNGFLRSPLLIVQAGVPAIFGELPSGTSIARPRPLATLPCHIHRQEGLIMLEWMLPGRFALHTALTMGEARALARDLLIETCAPEPPSDESFAS
jgi:5-methylcytosine-specific restriction endonuclease McrA